MWASFLENPLFWYMTKSFWPITHSYLNEQHFSEQPSLLCCIAVSTVMAKVDILVRILCCSLKSYSFWFQSGNDKEQCTALNMVWKRAARQLNVKINENYKNCKVILSFCASNCNNYLQSWEWDWKQSSEEQLLVVEQLK